MKGISNKRVNRLAVFALIGGLVCSQAAFAAESVQKQTWGMWFSSAWNTTKGKLSNARNSVVGFVTETIPTKASGRWSGAQEAASTKLAEVKASNFVKGATQAVVNNPKTSVVLAGVTAGFVAKAVYDSGVIGKTAKKNPKTATVIFASAPFLAVACQAAVVANPTLAGLGAVSILGGACLKYLWTNRKDLYAKTSN